MPPIWPDFSQPAQPGSSKVKVSGEEAPKNFQRPPWQLWAYSLNERQGIGVGEALERDGDAAGALRAYKEIEQQQFGTVLGEEAFAHRLGLLLKLGRSKEVLDEVRASFPGDPAKSPGPSVAVCLVIAHAYIHEKNFDQALAWFVETKKRSRGNIPVGRIVENVAGQVVRAWPTADFDRAERVWMEEPDFGPMFVKESKRRDFSRAPEPLGLDRWFLPATYGFKTGGEFASPAAPISAETVNPSGRFKIGALLPLTGRYGEAGQKALAGMKLALRRITGGANFSLVIRDVAAGEDSAVTAYRELVDEGALVILGPLTSEESKRLSAQAMVSGVPFISFTKKDFPKSASGSAFRLGGIADDQLKELLKYLNGELAVREMVVISTPNDQLSKEFIAPLEKLASSYSIQIKGAFAVSDASDPQQLEQIIAQNPDAIFSTSNLEQLLPTLRELKAKGKDNLVFCGIMGWADPVVIRAYSELLEGTVIVTPFYRDSKRVTVAEFVSSYESENNQTPTDFLTAQAYDATALAIKATEGVADDTTLSANQLRDRLTNMGPSAAVTGMLKVERSGEITRRMSILRVVRGELVEVVANGEVSGAAY